MRLPLRSSGSPSLRSSCRLATASFLALLGAAASAGSAARGPAVCPGAAGDDALTATRMGRFAPGERARLAFRWRGERPIELDAWVDFDGDGRWSDGEQVASGRRVAPGLETIELDVPSTARSAGEMEVRYRWRGEGVTAREAILGRDKDLLTGCAWRGGFALADLDGPVRALAVWNDGSGPALFAGGAFVAAGGVAVNHIAKWDGSAWSALTGPGGTGTNSTVDALAVYDDGSGSALYVGGLFHEAGGAEVNYVAKWNGSTWSALTGPSGMGVEGEVFALAAYNDGSGSALYVGGGFATAGGVAAHGIARWKGGEWSALAVGADEGVNGTVYSLTVWNSALYVGGTFVTAAGVTANNIARWNGSAWSPLTGPSGTGTSGGFAIVFALAVYDDGDGAALFAGGMFTHAGGLAVNYVARWSGSAWSALTATGGTGTYGEVAALAVWNDGAGAQLYLGGSFDTAGGVTVNNVASWDGSEFTPLSGSAGTGVDPYEVWALAVYDDGDGGALYAGGQFDTAGGMTAHDIARWSGTAWSPLGGAGSGGLDGDVLALAVYDAGRGPDLYAGGAFTYAGGTLVQHVARWNGTVWSPLTGSAGTGTSGSVESLAVYDDGTGPALVVGGTFETAGGVTANNIARWNGRTWSAFAGPSGTGTDGRVSALLAHDDGGGPALFAGGSFATAGGVTVNNVARWDGAQWSALDGPAGTGTSNWVFALAAFDEGSGPALFVGGTFTTAGGLTVNRIARWSGRAWSTLPGGTPLGMNGAVRALAVHDGHLVAGGDFTTAGPILADHLARWDGTSWSALGSGASGSVWTLATANLGDTVTLFAGGDFATAGGVTVNRVAEWQDDAWHDLSAPAGAGVEGADVFALAPFDDGAGESLFAGGRFGLAGGLPSANAARFSCQYGLFLDGFERGSSERWWPHQP